MIDNHYMSIRTHSAYKRCLVRVFIEANMSFIDAGRIANQLAHPQYGDMDIVSEDKSSSRRFGIWTSKDSKQGYATELTRAINFMCIATHTIGKSVAADIKELCAQFAMFRREVVVPPKDNGKSLHYTVTLTGKSAGRKDDLVMACGIALFYMFRSMNDQIFIQRCHDSGRIPF